MDVEGGVFDRCGLCSSSCLQAVSDLSLMASLSLCLLELFLASVDGDPLMAVAVDTEDVDVVVGVDMCMFGWLASCTVADSLGVSVFVSPGISLLW